MARLRWHNSTNDVENSIQLWRSEGIVTCHSNTEKLSVILPTSGESERDKERERERESERENIYYYSIFVLDGMFGYYPICGYYVWARLRWHTCNCLKASCKDTDKVNIKQVAVTATKTNTNIKQK